MRRVNSVYRAIEPIDLMLLCVCVCVDGGMSEPARGWIQQLGWCSAVAAVRGCWGARLAAPLRRASRALVVVGRAPLLFFAACPLCTSRSAGGSEGTAVGATPSTRVEWPRHKTPGWMTQAVGCGWTAAGAAAARRGVANRGVWSVPFMLTCTRGRQALALAVN